MPYKKIPLQSSEKKNIYPNKLMGQNFLRDKNVLNKIVAAANLTTKDNVLEIGPGLGVLTRELAKRAGRVVAVEKDRKSAQKLKEQLAEEKVENVEIVEGDILKFSIFHPSGGRPQDDNFQFSNKKNSNPLNPPLQGGQESTPLAQKLSPSTPLTQRGVGGLKTPYPYFFFIGYFKKYSAFSSSKLYTPKLSPFLLAAANNFSFASRYFSNPPCASICSL